LDKIAYPILGDEKKLPVHIIGLGKNYNQIHINREEGFPFNQILICTEGTGTLFINNKEYNFKKSQIIFLKRGIPHEYYGTSECMDLFWLVFDGNEIDNICEQFEFYNSTVTNTNDFDKVLEMFDNIFNVVKKADYYSGFHSSALLYTFIIELNRQRVISNKKNEELKNLQLQPIINYIDKNYQYDITLEELSKIAEFSPQYICRLFKECLNTRPFEYITKIRITKAKLLMLDTDLSLSEIHNLVGYKDISYFSAIFKRHEKMSPNDFRNMYRKYYKYDENIPTE